MTDTPHATLKELVETRYGEAPALDVPEGGDPALTSMLARGSCRVFKNTPVPDAVVNTLCAAALASPTKSDLQQRDIIILRSASTRRALADLVSGQAWVADAPLILIFCGNNRRQRQLHAWHGVEFANDHLDAFFNAVADAAIALGACVTAAEAMGLGCCPISAVRNEAPAVSELLRLPQHVFPFAGLALGYPAAPPVISSRLPLSVTCHDDHYREDDLKARVQAYDAGRSARQPYAKQRFPETFGEKAGYAWSDDKVRQYSREERAGFGHYVRAQGFRLD